MESFIIARVIHILSVVIWIGGVAMVTMVILPSIKKLYSGKEQITTFEAIEGRFAKIAQITTILTGLSGFYMIHVLDAWERYLNPSFWWIHAMTLIWGIFSIVLFIAEPFFLHKIIQNQGMKNPDLTMKIMQRAHWILLTLSLITTAGAVAGSHGWMF